MHVLETYRGMSSASMARSASIAANAPGISSMRSSSPSAIRALRLERLRLPPLLRRRPLLARLPDGPPDPRDDRRADRWASIDALLLPAVPAMDDTVPCLGDVLVSVPQWLWLSPAFSKAPFLALWPTFSSRFSSASSRRAFQSSAPSSMSACRLRSAAADPTLAWSMSWHSLVTLVLDSSRQTRAFRYLEGKGRGGGDEVA